MRWFPEYLDIWYGESSTLLYVSIHLCGSLDHHWEPSTLLILVFISIRYVPVLPSLFPLSNPSPYYQEHAYDDTPSRIFNDRKRMTLHFGHDLNSQLWGIDCILSPGPSPSDLLSNLRMVADPVLLRSTCLWLPILICVDTIRCYRILRAFNT